MVGVIEGGPAGFRSPVRPWSGRLDLNRADTNETVRPFRESGGTSPPQKRPKNTPEGVEGAQPVTPVTVLTSTEADALMRAIRSAREEGRHLDAKALGEIFERLGC